MKYLIVTADDLGLTESINEGIAKAYSEGILTTISIIPTGEAFDDAVTVIKNLKLEEIGAHLALSETKPLLKSSQFHKNHNEFFFKLFLGRIDLNDIYNELKAQLEALKKTGIKITHINSHEHIHIIPKVLNIFVRLAKEYNIPAIRYARGDRPSKGFKLDEMYKRFILSYFSGMTGDIFKNSGLLYTDFFLGLLDAGRLTEKTLIEMLNGLKDGVTELICHPGFLSPEVLEGYGWHIGAEEELFALTSKRVRKAIENNGIRLISFEKLLLIK